MKEAARIIRCKTCGLTATDLIESTDGKMECVWCVPLEYLKRHWEKLKLER